MTSRRSEKDGGMTPTISYETPLSRTCRPTGGRIAAEPAHPGAVMEQRGRRRAFAILFRREQPPVYRRDAEHRQHVRRHANGADPLGGAIARQIRVVADRDRHLFECAGGRFDVEVLRGREPVFGDAESR